MQRGKKEIGNQPTISELIEKISGMGKQIKSLEKKVDRLEELELANSKLKKENDKLKDQLAKYENPKNSRNSSVPPSKDENRPFKSRSLREKTGKKPGGQYGQEGTTLKMVAVPDNIIDHVPEYCKSCGENLCVQDYEVVEKRQVIDIPFIQPEYTEHRVFKRRCTCGYITKSDFPVEANASISYGSNVESLIGYWHSRQYIPFDRMREVFHDVFSLPVSEGGIHHILKRLVRKAKPAYALIKERLETSKAVGADETGVKVNGKKHWYWTWQNNKLTYITVSPNRGIQTIEQNFPKGLPNSVLIHDCWKSHFRTQAISHQLCIAHLTRELNYLAEKYKEDWPKRFKDLLNKATELKKRMAITSYHQTYQPRSHIEDQLVKMLKESVNEKHKELVSFKKRMEKYRDYIMTFLYHPEVPPDNNGSERAIRNVKVKQKISGQFKSINGAEQFGVLRSITDTAIKNGQNVLNALSLISNCQWTD